MSSMEQSVVTLSTQNTDDFLYNFLAVTILAVLPVDVPVLVVAVT